MEGRFGYVVLTARYFYVTALVHLTKDFDDLIYSVSFLFHDSGRVLARQSLIFNGPVYGGQVTGPGDPRPAASNIAEAGTGLRRTDPESVKAPLC